MAFFALLGLAVYFAPTFIGWDKKGNGRVALVNILLGWTVIGWVVALVWALKAPDNPNADPQP